ncbi:MAG TPA: cyclic nucleotide-binding domain-containing protein [Polyangiaceae bacterium]|jgi:CRP-like cAMP-binding protein|nr:cyclic nucleotide-binding domain-containing protein [Polyangiaceae bacterium]
MNEVVIGAEPSRVGLRDRVLAMRAQPMFEGLDDEGLLILAEHGRAQSYRDGDVVSVEGEPARAVFMVTEGEIVVTRQGKELLTRRAGEGYGALPMLAREPSVHAFARGETRTLEIPAAAFEGALIENHSLLRNTLRAIGSGVLARRGNLPGDPKVPRAVDDGVYFTEPRTMVERLIELRQSPFGHINLEALVDMARQMTEVRYPAGHLLWSTGDTSTHSLHIEAGRIRCTAPDGASVAVGAGFTIGVLDVWGTHRRVYEARAEVPLIAYRIDFEDFLTVLEAHPEVGLELLRGFARELSAGM